MGRCINKQCRLRGSYGDPNGFKTHCHKHKLRGQVKHISDKCGQPDCYRQGRYNYPVYKDRSKFYCSDHRSSGMVIVAKTKFCAAPECMNTPTHGHTAALWCKEHALPDSKFLLKVKCTVSNCHRKCLVVDNTLFDFCSNHL